LGIEIVDSMVLARGVAALGKTGLAPHDFVLEAKTLLAKQVAFEDFSFAGLDPQTMLPAWAICASRVPSPLVPRWIEIEMTEARHHSLAEIPYRPAETAFLLSDYAGGALDRSLRYREILRPVDLEHEVRIVFRSRGRTWGGLALIRSAGEPDFEPDEIDMLKHMAAPFAEGLRHSFLQRAPGTAVIDDSPAVVVLSADFRVVSCTDTAAALLHALRDVGVPDPEGLPTCVRVVALRASGREMPTLAPPSARARTRGGAWVTIRGAALDAGRRIAIVMEPTPTADVTSMMLAAHGLTVREQQIAEHVLRGLSTQDVGEALKISEYTVQDHLKSIFDKTGVSSRKELAGRLFLGTPLPAVAQGR
jgi:DNA-binding CsgD family transcriptional regulator